MVEFSGGSSPETVDERPMVLKKVNSFIHDSFHKDVSYFTNQDILKLMSRATKSLKKADLIEVRSKEELDKYKITSYPAFLWQEKLVASFYLFVIMLGYIDKKIDDEEKSIKFNENFASIDNEEYHPHIDNIEESNSMIQKYLLEREEVLNGYKTVIEDRDEVILKVLEEVPSYSKFDSLYQNQKEHGTQLYLNQQLINAYNLGYMFDKGVYEDIINKYRNLYSDLVSEKQQDEPKGKMIVRVLS